MSEGSGAQIKVLQGLPTAAHPVGCPSFLPVICSGLGVYQSAFARETEPVSLFEGIGPHDCRGLASPTYESPGRRLRSEPMQCLKSKGRLLQTPSCSGMSVFALFRPSTDWVRPTTHEEQSALLGVPDINVTPIHKTPLRNILSGSRPNLWAPWPRQFDM